MLKKDIASSLQWMFKLPVALNVVCMYFKLTDKTMDLKLGVNQALQVIILKYLFWENYGYFCETKLFAGYNFK